MLKIGYLSSCRSDRQIIEPVVRAAERLAPHAEHLKIYADPSATQNPTSIVRSLLERLDPHLHAIEALVVVGDRYEVLCAATLALQHRVRILHLGGGEMPIAVATPDTRYRDAITLLAAGHCVFTPAAEARVSKLLAAATGDEQREHTSKVTITGNPALEELVRIRDESTKPSLTNLIPPLRSETPFVLVSYHPSPLRSEFQPAELAVLEAAVQLLAHEYCVILTQPNNDAGAEEINLEFLKWARKNPERVFLVSALGQQFGNMIKHSALLLGNSSAGRIEASVFGTPVFEIGLRQLGRPQPENIYSFVFGQDPDKEDIAQLAGKALELAQAGHVSSISPWYRAGAAEGCVTALNRMLEEGTVEVW